MIKPQEAEAGGSGVQSQPELHCAFTAHLECRRLSQKLREKLTMFMHIPKLPKTVLSIFFKTLFSFVCIGVLPACWSVCVCPIVGTGVQTVGSYHVGAGN